MNENLKIENMIFWNIIKTLEALPESISLMELAIKLKVGPKEVKQGISYLRKFNHNIEMEGEEDEQIILRPPPKRTLINFSLSLLDWLALQAYFPLLENIDDKPYSEQLLQKLAHIESENKEYNLMENELEFIYENNKQEPTDNNRIRVIVKISSYNKFNLFPYEQEIKAPYIAVSEEGNIIWSATMNIDRHLLDWIKSFGNDIDIIYPNNLKDIYNEYISKGSNNFNA